MNSSSNKGKKMQWEAVIGLEVHVQLSTQSKLFSDSATRYGAMPNAQANLIDLAMPGTLPVLNREAVKMAIKLGLALHAEIAEHSVFARKNYFYPDLPKGYQISQYEFPIVSNGFLEVSLENGENKKINITRAHLEEDAGKSIHDAFKDLTAVDLNRAGVPLIEVVSAPDIRTAKEAVSYLKALHALVCYLQICDGNMQEGSFRCDANVSVRPSGAEKLGTRTETKNVNSFRFVEKAIDFEIARQIQILENGGTIIQETLLYDPEKNETRPMRSKEEAMDYRYFPDPDLLPLEIHEEWIHEIKETLPELPEQKKKRFQASYQLSAYDAQVLVNNQNLALYFETVLKKTKASPKLVVNWIMGELSAALNTHKLSIENCPVSANALAELIERIADDTISGKMAKTIFEIMWESGETPDVVIAKQGLKQITDTNAIEKIIDEVLVQNPKQLEDYRSGKEKLFGFFVGQTMKLSQGKANPDQVNKILKEKLNSSS